MAQQLIGGTARRARPLSVVLAGLVLATVLAAAAAGAPTSFELRFDGVHMPATIASNSGLQHEGAFTASEPLCSSGQAVDIRFEGQVAVRRHTCSDGSGSFTARIEPPTAEHGGQGDWRIVEGSGQYEKLRGKGRFTGVLVSGDPADPATVGYRTTWAGAVDFDDLAPELELSTARLRRIARPRGAYALRIAFSARDAAGGAVSYRVRVTPVGSPFAIATGGGTTTGGTVSTSLRIRPGGIRRIAVEIVAADPVGNERVATRSLRVPS